MADILHRTTKQLLHSVNTPDYVPAWRKGEPIPTDGDWIVNPDLSAVAGLAPKYWKLTGNTVSAMTRAERDAVDAAEAAAALAAERQADKATIESGALDRVIAVLAPKLGTDEATLRAEIAAAIDARPAAVEVIRG